MRGYHTSRTPLTCSLHGMLTGPPASSTTMALGLPAATASVSAFSSPVTARVFACAEGIDYGADGRIVDNAGGEHAAHDATDHVVQAGLRNLAVLYGFLEGLAEVVVVAGHVLVESAEGGLDGAVGCAPVGEHK